MGGDGSGRIWFSGTKPTTNDFISIDSRKWQRKGLIFSPMNFQWTWSWNDGKKSSIEVQVQKDRVILDYKHRRGNEDWESLKYPVYLDMTPSHFGGRRYWFLCPSKGCRKRVAILYCDGLFACRNCHKLAYPSQRENQTDRATRRIDKIRDYLGWEPGFLNGEGWKPKGMHWNKFEKLSNKHRFLSDMILAHLA